MDWYSVRVLMRCTGKGQAKRIPLYEDRLVLVKARSHEAAQKKAEKLVKENEVPMKNSLGNTFRWRLVHVYECVHLFDKELKEGTEVYWRYIRSSDPVKRLKREGTMNAVC